jgi:hypothetical protein
MIHILRSGSHWTFRLTFETRFRGIRLFLVGYYSPSSGIFVDDLMQKCKSAQLCRFHPSDISSTMFARNKGCRFAIFE